MESANNVCAEKLRNAICEALKKLGYNYPPERVILRTTSFMRYEVYIKNGVRIGIYDANKNTFID